MEERERDGKKTTYFIEKEVRKPFLWSVYEYTLDHGPNERLGDAYKEHQKTELMEFLEIAKETPAKPVIRIRNRDPLELETTSIEGELYEALRNETLEIDYPIIRVSGEDLCIGEMKPKRTYDPFIEEQLLVDFININTKDNDSIYGFVKEYGFLGYYFTLAVPVEHSMHFMGFEEVIYIKAIAQYAQHVERLIRYYLADDYTSLVHEYMSNPEAGFKLLSKSKKSLEGQFQRFIISLFEPYLEKIRLYPMYGQGRFVKGYSADVLLTVIMYRLYTILTEAVQLEKCADKNCGKLFIKDRNNKKYCNDGCGSRKRGRDKTKRDREHKTKGK